MSEALHYVSKPALDAAVQDKNKILVAACGEVRPAAVTFRARTSTCPGCRKAMIQEEREAM